MPYVADDYEAFIESIISGIEQTQRDIRNLGGGRRNRLLGKSGQAHQIDVSFVDHSFPEPAMVLIECKRYNLDRRVEASVLKILKYNADDICSNPEYPDSSKMLVVSTGGFRSGARRIADHEGIILQTVNHGPPFAFDYEDIIGRAVVDSVDIGEVVNVRIGRPADPGDDSAA